MGINRDRLPPLDDGCRYSPSCLICPLAVCVLDKDPRQRAADEREALYAQIRALTADGLPRREIAAQLGVSLKAVVRARHS
ncbi:MAG: hypothetical protein IT318_20145 [Anaerolineales bacterium]|nr:hypothetical protein [Anaerolineales bacterium]